MTYCCGILVRDGLVMIADTRTNAGLDNVSTFRKLHTFREPGERIMALASSGNLSISQSVVSMLTEGFENPATGEMETLKNAPTMFQAAQRIGHAIRRIHDIEAAALAANDVKFDVAFLFGGQIKGERPRHGPNGSARIRRPTSVDLKCLSIGDRSSCTIMSPVAGVLSTLSLIGASFVAGGPTSGRGRTADLTRRRRGPIFTWWWRAGGACIPQIREGHET